MTEKEKLIHEIEHLPNELVIEVFDFVKFLEFKIGKVALGKNPQQLSEKVFEKIWNNDSDAIYDSL